MGDNGRFQGDDGLSCLQGLVDFGIIGYLDEKTMLEIANVFLGYAEHNYDMVMEALVDAALINEEKLIYFSTGSSTMYGLKGRGQTEDH